MGKEKVITHICFQISFYYRLEEFVNIAKNLGYTMFCWNGKIYKVPDNFNDDILDKSLFNLEDLY